VRIELVLKGIVPVNHNFPGGDYLHLLQIGLFRYVEGTLYLSKETHLL
jgi:hypothetical protein